MEVYRLGPGGGTILELLHVTTEPVSGPEVANKAFLYFLKDSGFRVKLFGQDGEPLTESNVSLLLDNQTVAPPQVAGKGQLFAKTISGKVHLYYIADDGTIYQLTPNVAAADLTAETNARIAADSAEVTARDAAIATSAALKVSKAGDTMSGDLAMGGHSVTGVQVVSRAGDMAVGPTSDSGLGLQANNANQVVITKDLVKILSVPLDMNSNPVKNISKLGVGGVPSGATVDIQGPSDSAAALIEKLFNSDASANGNSVRRLWDFLNGSAARTTFVRQIIEMVTKTAGSEQARYTLDLMIAGALTTLMQMDATGIAFTKQLLMNGQGIKNLLDPVSPQDGDTKAARDAAIAAAIATVSGGLETFIAEHIVPGGGETSFAFTGLNGDTDEVYILRYKLIKGTVASFVMSMFFNATHNLFHFTQFLHYSTSAVGSGTNADLALFGNNSGSDKDVAYGEIIIYAARDGNLSASRSMKVDATERHSGLGGIHRMIDANWEDQATLLSRIDFLCDVANGFGEGTYVRLYKRKKQ